MVLLRRLVILLEDALCGISLNAHTSSYLPGALWMADSYPVAVTLLSSQSRIPRNHMRNRGVT